MFLHVVHPDRHDEIFPDTGEAEGRARFFPFGRGFGPTAPPRAAAAVELPRTLDFRRHV